MTKTQECIKYAIASGFRVSRDGKHVFGSTGVELKQRLSGRSQRRYWSVKVRLPGEGLRRDGAAGIVVPVHVHRLVAYLKFGEAALESTVTRHLDDDPLNNAWDNIVLGTKKENAMDRSEEDRRLHARKAGRTNSRPDEFWIQVEAEHAAGASYKELRERHGLSKSTLSYRLSKTGERTVMK